MLVVAAGGSGGGEVHLSNAKSPGNDQRYWFWEWPSHTGPHDSKEKRDRTTCELVV